MRDLSQRKTTGTTYRNHGSRTLPAPGTGAKAGVVVLYRAILVFAALVGIGALIHFYPCECLAAGIGGLLGYLNEESRSVAE